MMPFNELKTTVAEKRRLEIMMLNSERNQAYIDYIAMMSDITLPEVTHEE